MWNVSDAAQVLHSRIFQQLDNVDILNTAEGNMDDDDQAFDWHDQLTDEQVYQAVQALKWQNEISDQDLYDAAEALERQQETNDAVEQRSASFSIP